jgi:hypothetical protein
MTFFEFHTRTPSSLNFILILPNSIYFLLSLIISYSSLQLNDVDANTRCISSSSYHATINPTYGLQASPMKHSLIKNLMKSLIHRDYHWLSKPHLGGRCTSHGGQIGALTQNLIIYGFLKLHTFCWHAESVYTTRNVLTTDAQNLSLNRHNGWSVMILWRKNHRQKRGVVDDRTWRSHWNRHNRLWRYWTVITVMTI